MLAKGLNQPVRLGARNLTTPLLPPDCGPKLDLCKRENGEAMSSVTRGEG